MTTEVLTRVAPRGGGIGRARRHPVRVMLLAVSLLAMLVRAAWVLHTPHYRAVWDASLYLQHALYLYSNHHLPRSGQPGRYHWADAYWPPFYPMLLATGLVIHHWLAFSHIRALTTLRLLEAVVWGVADGLLSLISLRLFGRRVSVIVGFLTAVYLPLVALGTSLYSESMWVPLLIAAVAAYVEYRRTRRLWLLASAGVLTGLGALTHSNGIFLVPPLILAIWLESGHRSARAGRIAVYVAVVALTLTPWTVRNWVDYHRFVPISTSLGYTLAGVYNNQSRESAKTPGGWRAPGNLPYYRHTFAVDQRENVSPAVSSDRETDRALQYVEAHPTYPLVVAYWNTRRLLELGELRFARDKGVEVGFNHQESDIAAYVFWVIGLLAIAGCFTPVIRRGEKWIWLVPLAIYLGIVFIQSEVPRFRAPMDPFILILAAAALSELMGWCEARALRWRRPVTDGEYANT